MKLFDTMKNHIRIMDFTALQSDFDDIQTELGKCVGYSFATDKLQTLPAWVIKNLVALEDCVLEVSADEKKKMNKNNAQAYTKLKQKLKKYFSETGDHENLYQVQIENYRKNPVEDEKDEKAASEEESDDSGSSSEESSSEESSSEEEKPAKTKAAKKESASSSSEEESGSSSSDESSSGESESSSEDEAGSKDAASGDEDSEEEVLKQGELPKKYAFLALPRENMTP